MIKPTVWNMMECPGNARWTEPDGSPFADGPESVCTTSGCECGGRVKLVGQTTDGDEAAKWFRRPDVTFDLNSPVEWRKASLAAVELGNLDGATGRIRRDAAAVLSEYYSRLVVKCRHDFPGREVVLRSRRGHRLSLRRIYAAAYDGRRLGALAWRDSGPED